MTEINPQNEHAEELSELELSEPVSTAAPENAPEMEAQPEDSVQEESEGEAAEKEFSEKTYYEEPLRLSGGDLGGVILALVMLTLIGVGGYIWLTPGVSVSDVLHRDHQTMTADAGHDHAGMQTSGMESHEDHAGMGEAIAEHTKCAWCGMFADMSMSRISAKFAGGISAEFDSWGCLFQHAAEEGLKPSDMRVVSLDGSLEEPNWLNADGAWFLYKMDKGVQGSMPPFTGAWSDRSAAEARLGELGGELVDFSGLTEKMNGWMSLMGN